MMMVLPFSTAMALLFSALGTIFSLLGLRRGPCFYVLRSPIVVLALLLFLWLAISTSWAVAPNDELIEGIWKYRKLLLLALVATSLVACQKNVGFLLNFFLIGCTVAATATLLSRFGLMEWLLGAPTSMGGWSVGGTTQRPWFQIGGPVNPTFGRNHITQGAFLTFAAMLAIGRSWFAYKAQNGSKTSASVWIWTVLAGLLLLAVFSIQGRSGYVLAFTGAIYWVFSASIKRTGIRKLAPFLLAICALITLILSSPHFLARSNEAVEDIIQYSTTGAQTSQGERIGFWRAGLALALERPLIGYGVGGYAQAYSELPSEPDILRDSRAQPHSEYVILLVQGGMVGVMLFFLLVVLLVERSRTNLNYEDGYGILCVVLLFTVYSGFNSAIWDLAEGHFFLVLAALVVCQFNDQLGPCDPKLS